MTIYLIRHTEVAITQKICYGQTDVGLADTFNKEAQKIKEQIAETQFDKVYSSPLSRCKNLSEFLFDSEVVYDDRLKELNFGDWELQEWDKIVHPKFKTWMDDFVNVPCPNGESFIELHGRVSSFLTELQKLEFEKLAIITHGGVIRSLLAHINNEDLTLAFKKNIEYGEIFEASI